MIQNWQPIETAPRDGTEVILWDVFGVTTAYWGWSDDYAKEIGYIPTWWATYPGAHNPQTPTHWMPIQPPPGATP